MLIETVTEDVFQTMGIHLITAATQLFEAYGMQVCERSGDPERDSIVEAYVVSYIGFTGDKIRGAIVMTASPASVRSWQSAIGETTASLCDTIGEVSNMLLGRLKGHLLMDGVTIMLSTPTTASGKEVSFSATAGARSSWIGLDGSNWRTDVRLDVAFEAGFELAPRPRSVVAQAGEAFLF